jgi:isorenieratene synthase
MRQWLQKKIRQKLGDYKIPTNHPDTALPKALNGTKKVAIIGGGIAGLSAAANLTERGFSVDLFEKNDYLGGKLGSWQFESNGEVLQTEHGFHAFFRQYYNLRDFMQRLDIYRHLIPIDDYVILYENGKRQGFAGIDQTPGLNIWDLRKKGVINWTTFLSPFSMHYLKLLRFNPDKTFKKYDHISFAKFAKQSMMSPHLQLVFNSFARAFFAEPDKMSMAELMKGFHFYFLSNEDGLIYDVLNDDFEFTFLSPVAEYIRNNGGNIYTNTGIDTIGYQHEKFIIRDKQYDYCIIASDVKHTKQLFANSPDLHAFPQFSSQMKQLQTSGRYAVLRIWTDRFENDKSLPFFLFTDRLKCLDSITLYHKMEKTSAAWSEQNNGGIFELHSYALPENLLDDTTIRQQLLDECYHYLPELKGLHIRHEYFQHRDDFPSFQLNNYAHRPSVETEIPGLYLAGDWVKLPTTAMLMEAAYTSGAMSANAIFTREQLQENPLFSVSNNGILA